MAASVRPLVLQRWRLAKSLTSADLPPCGGDVRQDREEQRRALTLLASLLAATVICTSASAACPIELATYRAGDESTAIEFRPTDGAAEVTNAFRLLLGDDTVMDGHVMWTQGVERPNGMISHECPDGDVTGPEYEACTAWQGVVYSVDASGGVGLLPREGEPAPLHLLFPDLAYALHAFPPLSGRTTLPLWEVFTLSGCQE